MCTRRIRLLDHEMERLKLLKHKLSDHWQEIVALAEEDQKYVSLPQQLQMLLDHAVPSLTILRVHLVI